MRRSNPNNVDISAFQPSDFDTDELDAKTLTALIEHGDITRKSIALEVAEGKVEIISPLEKAQKERDKRQLDIYFESAKNLYQRSDGKLDVKHVDDAKHGRSIFFWAIATFRDKKYLDDLIKRNKNFLHEVYRNDDLEPVFPLFYAILIDNAVAVDAMLEHNPKLLFQESNFGATPAHFATALHRLSILDVMHKHNKKTARIRTTPQLTPLHTEIAEGNIDDDTAVLWLLEHDNHSDDEKNICDLGDNNQVTALHLAVKRGRCKTVELLLDHGADFTLATGAYASPPNKIPLQLAADAGDNNMMRLLLLHGARPEPKPAPDRDSPHPINSAKLNQRLQIVMALFEYRNTRNEKSKHLTSFLGITKIKIEGVIDYTVVYSRKDKRDAVDALVAAILNDPNDEHDPLESVPHGNIGPLLQGELKDIVQPLIDEHERRVKAKAKTSPGGTPRRSPSPSPSRRSSE